MRLSARADYALRAAIELAATERNHITAEQLARAQRIPAKFLEAILTQLRRADLVRSQRGPEGGFWLARPAADISLADIIRAIDGPLVGVRASGRRRWATAAPRNRFRPYGSLCAPTSARSWKR
jgi:Rrf2 family protein